jgi:hypothetical protein
LKKIAYLSESGKVIGIEENPGHPNQKIYIIKINCHAVIVPYVENDKAYPIKRLFIVLPINT